MSFKRLSLTHRLLSMHLVMFLFCVSTIGVVAWGWFLLSDFRYFVVDSDRTVDVFQGNHLNQLYVPWRQSLERAIGTRKAEDYKEFDKNHKAYKQTLDNLLKQSNDATWHKDLQELVNQLSAFDQSYATLKVVDQLDLRKPLTQKDGVSPEEIIPTIISQLSPKEQALKDRLIDFQMVLMRAKLAMLRYQSFEVPADLAMVREYFLNLDDSILQMQQTATDKIKTKIDNLDKSTSAYFGDFETRVNDIQARDALVITIYDKFLNSESLNPLSKLSWSVLKPKGSGKLLENMNRVSMILVLSALFAVGALVFAAFYIQKMLEKPLKALISYTSHAFLTRKRTEVPGHDRGDELGVLARAIQSLLVHIDQKIDEELKRAGTVVANGNNSTTPTTTSSTTKSDNLIPELSAGKMEELSHLLEDTFNFTEDFIRRKAFDHNKSVETGELADQTRQSIQKAALNIHDLMNEYNDMLSLCSQIIRKMGRYHQETKRLDVKLYNVSMAAGRFQDLIKALNGFCQEIALLQHNFTITSYENPEAGMNNAMQHFTNIRQQYDEIAMTLAHESGIINSYLQACHETVKGIQKNSTSLQSDTQQLNASLSNSPATLKSLHEMLQAVSFRVGRLAVVLLEHSADVVKSNSAVHRLSGITKDLRRLLQIEDQNKPQIPASSLAAVANNSTHISGNTNIAADNSVPAL